MVEKVVKITKTVELGICQGPASELESNQTRLRSAGLKITGPKIEEKKCSENNMS